MSLHVTNKLIMHNLQMDLKKKHVCLKWHFTICKYSQIAPVLNTSQEELKYFFSYNISSKGKLPKQFV